MAFGSSQWMYATDTGGYDIPNSLRFNDNDSAYLSKTFSAGNRRTWTFSAWVKLGNLGVAQKLFTVGASSSNKTEIEINSSGAIWIEDKLNSSTQAIFKSTQLLRDTSAWYHLVVAVDTTQGTADNRVKIYLNGNQVTDFTTYETYPDLNDDWLVNSAAAHYLGKRSYSSSYFDGYLAEVNFIDGYPTGVTQSNWASTNIANGFGENDATYGHWKAKEYTGSYGDNGFYLDFKGSSYVTATGGTVSYDGDYKIHKFTSNGTFSVTSVTGAQTLTALLVAGGGGSSAAEGYYGSTGGGGGGGMVEVASHSVTAGTHSIVVGAGGAGSADVYSVAGSGGDSTGLGFTAKGGGGGVDYGTNPAASGGSGAGGSEPSLNAGSSTQSSSENCATGAVCYGNAGSNAAGYGSGSGGGGGAGSAGSGVGTGSGGSGRANSITGSSVTYAAGGYGAAGNSYNHGNAGAANTGNGASGAGASGGNEGNSASGGSGIVVIRYKYKG